MARLSSMTSNLRFLSDGSGFMGVIRFCAGQLQGERSALAWAIALHGQRTAYFLRGERAAMQTEAVSILARGETVVENAGHVFWWNPNAIIRHGNPDAAATVDHAHRESFVHASRLLAGVFGIAQQVDQNLQDFVLLGVQGRHMLKFA